MKKNILFPISTLVIASFFLFITSTGLQGVAQAKAEETRQWHMETILPGAQLFTEESYTGDDSNIKTVYKAENGYVIETSVYGYVDEVQMLIGVSKEGTVTGVVVTKLSETYGLGAKALTDHVFLSQFLNGSSAVEIGSDVDGITGATVTSKAVAKSINSAVAYVTGADIETGATSWGG